MRLLLDTHALLWFVSAPEHLTQTVIDAVCSPQNAVGVSAASAYEIALRVARGKLPPLPLAYDTLCGALRIDGLPIRPELAERAGRLDTAISRDPWDRIIAAHALVDGWTVVTLDPVIAAFGARTLW
jgi:PIN domain nuclease of toxin-antitoxin system